MLVDPVSEHGDIGVDAGVVGVSTADSPGGGADDFVVEEYWSAGVTLASVFASFAEESSAEHTLKKLKWGGMNLFLTGRILPL